MVVLSATHSGIKSPGNLSCPRSVTIHLATQNASMRMLAPGQGNVLPAVLESTSSKRMELGTARTVVRKFAPPKTSKRKQKMKRRLALMNEVPHFDRWSFDRRSHAASEASSLDFTDLRTMQVENHAASRSRRWIPAFAASDESLRLLLLWRTWRYLHGRASELPKKFLTNYAALDKLATAKMKRCERRTKHHLPGAHFRAVHHSGTYMALQSAIAYRSWRLGWDSPAIATSLGTTAVMIRTSLERMRRMGEMLRLPLGISHASKGTTHRQNVGRPTNNKGASQMKPATIKKHVQTLQKVARKHGGVLPTYSWLNAHGFFGAYESVRKSGALKSFRRAH